MRTRFGTLLVFAALLLGSAPAWSAGTYNPPSPSPAPMPTTPAMEKSPEEKAAEDRRSAEDLYRKAFHEAYAGRDELAAADSLRALGDEKSLKAADKQAKSGRKKLEKSVDKLEEAVTLDPKYHEAWNMLGFCRRKLGDVAKAFEAYERCLALAPDYEPAHEYLGEAYLQSGQLDKAEWKLSYLQQRKSEWAPALARAIERFKQQHAGAAVPATGTAAAPDSVAPATAGAR